MISYVLRFLTTYLTLKELYNHVKDNNRDKRPASGGDQEPDERDSGSPGSD